MTALTITHRKCSLSYRIMINLTRIRQIDLKKYYSIIMKINVCTMAVENLGVFEVIKMRSKNEREII
jgi:hypothetical protein